MATIDQIKKHYDNLTARERFALIMGAYVRKDEPTIDELLVSAPRKVFSMPHTRGLTDGFQFAAMYHMIDQLGYAVSLYWFMQVSEAEKPGKVITIGSVTYDLDNVLTNVFRRMLSNAEAWREVCQEYKIDPEGVLQHYPHAPTLEMGVPVALLKKQRLGNVPSNNQSIRQAPMTNTLDILEKTAHSAVIEKLLRDDPRLVSKHTTRQYRSDLLAFDAWRDHRPITKTLVEEYAAKLPAEGKAPNTINQRLAAIRWYARKIADLAADYSGDEQLIRQAARVATVRDVKGERPETGRHIEQGELSALIDACTSDSSPAGIRDSAIIALAWSTGLRRDEISRIELYELVNKTEDGLDIAIVGKGGKV